MKKLFGKVRRKKPLPMWIRFINRSVLLVLLTVAVYYSYLYIFVEHFEPRSNSIYTNRGAIYEDEQIQRVLDRYSFFRDTEYQMDETNSYVIPGLKSTRTLRTKEHPYISMCTSMTPQAVCTVENYLLIGAYCHSERHNSVIYVIDRMTHMLVKEVVLPGQPHVGSIAYDQEHHNIWVACFQDDNAYVNSFTLKELERYRLSDADEPIAYSQFFPILTQHRASFIAYSAGGLYVGYFSNKRGVKCTVQRFEIGYYGELLTSANTNQRTVLSFPHIANPSKTIQISRRCQGLTFLGQDILISQSAGPLPGKIQLFKNDPDDEILDARNKNAVASYLLPPMLEQIHIDETGKLYMIFESAAYAYKLRPGVEIDRVLVVDLTNLIEGVEDE